MQVKSIAECSKGSILQYFRPSSSYHLSLRSLFHLFLSGHFTQILGYINFYFRFECSNPLYGTTVNPHNVLRGPGGSSGGEGALIGSGGSLLGFGTDIGGSLRIPSNFCGICCLKPTAGRLRYVYHMSWLAKNLGNKL